MRPRPPIASGLASLSLIALGLMIPARADAASSTYAVADLGANISGLVLGNGGQVAGLRPGAGGSVDPGTNPPATAFEYDGGRSTTLSYGGVPVAVADDGRVVAARWPTDAFVTMMVDSHPFEVSSITAGNRLGALVGTATFQPYDYGAFNGNGDLQRTTTITPFI